MADKHLVFAILKFLEEQRKLVSEDSEESLEVAQQCLESAYGVSSQNPELAEAYPIPAPLPDIFAAGLNTYGIKVGTGPTPAQVELSEADKIRAEKHKQDGNEFMKVEKYDEAIGCYNKAIEINPTNAVYFCNRAAAHSKLNNHLDALSDCEQAINIDPTYSKAYGRKGLAHSALSQHQKAKECYVKAIELDPENRSYKQNKEIAEQKIRETRGPGGVGSPGMGSPAGGMPGMPGLPGMGGLNMGGMDFSSLLNNPALMNMATNMMQNPQMQQMMASMMSGAGQGPGAGVPGAPGAPAGGPEGIGGLLQAGQQLAQQMQQSNPELVDQLRSQMRTDESGNGEQENKDDTSPPQ